MSKVTTLHERIEMLNMAQAGFTDQQIATHLGWSPSTVRKWRRRGQKGGRANLASHMGRARQGALSSFPQGLREQIRAWRSVHPGWGAKTLQAELRSHPAWHDQALPSRASIGRFLREQGLSRVYQHHHDLPQSPPQAATQAHEVWEMDAKGYQALAGVGYISLINLNDRFSHARLLSFPCQVGQQRWIRHPDSEDYQCALRLAFSQWGLPNALQVDHGTVFIDHKSASPFPTRLHLWLLALGIDLRFGRVGQPRDQAMTERSHQLWEAQCLRGQAYDDWRHLYLTLQQRRHFLNWHLACASLDDQPPLHAHPQACHALRPYRPEWESDLLDLARVWDYLAQGYWYRWVSQGGTLTIGQQVYYVGHAWAGHEVELRFDPQRQHFIVYDAHGQCLRSCPIAGISIKMLMGKLADHFNLPCFQLALPFAGETQAVLRLFETIPV